ncbi:Angiopoietin-like protein 8 [Liparis tanakae]|uniref:Angiopoietin-like protein 8 n=1 Tax=Liparis tanakae TaxID=230148 RepID=A0A4Z2HWF0_9TELE|nr:Angiopoietin-like protein 8 [Liparis tanakae]
MKTMWGLCLLCLAGSLRAARAAPARKTGRTEDAAARQEDVNVLMFGFIQLSESLNYVHESTEAKIAVISQTVRRHEGTLHELGREIEQAAEVEKQIEEVMHLLQAQMAEQRAQTKTAEDRLGRAEREEAELKTKVKQLELHLNTSVSIKELQGRAEEQSNILKDLQYFTDFQKENIEAQNEKLSELEEKMSDAMT